MTAMIISSGGDLIALAYKVGRHRDNTRGHPDAVALERRVYAERCRRQIVHTINKEMAR